MGGRRGWSLLGLGLAALFGCDPATCNNLLQPAAPTVPAEPAAASETKELPPRQAGRACLATAQELEKSGHDAEAIAQYEKARQHDPSLTQVAHRLAVLYDRRCDYERARAEYQLALKQGPRDPDLLNDMGYSCSEREDWAEAEKWLRQATAIDPGHRPAWVNLGIVLARQGRDKESYEAFAKVLRPGEAHSNLGVIQAQRGQLAEARESLRQALALEPQLKQPRAVLDYLEHVPARAP